MKLNRIIILIMVGFFLITQTIPLIDKTSNNIGNTILNKIWLSRKIIQLADGRFVTDDLPDDWIVNNWGNSTQEQHLDNSKSCNGDRSLVVHKTNPLGATSIYQIIKVEPNKNYKVSICSMGDGGNIILVPLNSKGERTEGNEIRLNITPSESWKTHEWQVNTTENSEYLQIWIAVYGDQSQTWFDDINFGMYPDQNLLTNQDFENDGSEIINPTSISKPTTFALFEKLPIKNRKWSRGMSMFSYLDGNTTDSINHMRNAFSVDDSNALVTDTGWLIGDAQRHVKVGNTGIAQNLFKLILKIDPGNPNIHTQLGNLYYQSGAYDIAIQEYLLANPENIPELAYNLGILYLNQKGDIGNAIKYLSLAQKDELLRVVLEQELMDRYQLGQDLLNKKYYDEAKKQFVLVGSLSAPGTSLHENSDTYLSLLSNYP